jgi:hypothetical protein
MPRRTMIANRDNLHEVVAALRPDLRLMTRKELDQAIALLVDARERGRPWESVPPINPGASASHGGE